VPALRQEISGAGIILKRSYPRISKRGADCSRLKCLFFDPLQVGQFFFEFTKEERRAGNVRAVMRGAGFEPTNSFENRS
jgi:hypothetical protein